MPVRTLIVGLGQIGMGYDLDLPDSYVYTHARAVSRHAAFSLEGGVDVDGENRRRFEDVYCRPAFADLQQALEATKPELVVIAVPTPAHAETVRAVLRDGRPKAILSEKPLSHDLREAREMVDECAHAQVSLYVNYIRRADPGAIEIKRRIESGAIATPVKGVVWYSKGFVHNGSHFFNLLQYWLGAVRDAQIVSAGPSLKDDDAEPDVRVTFARGSILFLAASEEHFSYYCIDLIAPNGRLRYDRGGSVIEWQPATAHPRLRDHFSLSETTELIPSGMDRCQWNVVEELSAGIAGRENHLCTAAEALMTLEEMQRILDKR